MQTMARKIDIELNDSRVRRGTARVNDKIYSKFYRVSVGNNALMLIISSNEGYLEGNFERDNNKATIFLVRRC